MSDAAHNLSLQIKGASKSLSKTIRITASQMMATYVLPNILNDLKKIEPNIIIDLVASEQTDNLLRCEADIAIRMYPPTQDDAITKKIGDLPLGMFATHSYIKKKYINHSR